jgi:hypothetical protein
MPPRSACGSFIRASKQIYVTVVFTVDCSVKTDLPTHGSIQSADTASGKVFYLN